MQDPRIVEHPVLFPGHCRGCGTAKGPLVDTMINHPAQGRLYFCLANCLSTMARAAGYLTPEEADGLAETLAERSEQIRTLNQALEEATDNRVVSLDQLRDLFDEARSRERVTAKEPA